MMNLIQFIGEHDKPIYIVKTKIIAVSAYKDGLGDATLISVATGGDEPATFIIREVIDEVQDRVDFYLT